MKKGWKVFLIVCGSVFVAGLALFITGAAMGATFSGLGRAFGFDSPAWIDMYDDTDFEDEIVTENAGEPTYVKGNSSSLKEFSNIQDIEVDASYVEIDVKTYDQNMISVDTSGIKNGLEQYIVCKNEGPELKVETTNRRKWEVMSNKSAGRMVIWLPKDQAFLEASFDVGAGYLKIDDIEAGDLSIHVGAGKTVVNNFDAGNLDVESGAGQSILTGTVSADANIECGMGETKVTLKGSQNEYDYQLKCSVGELIVGNDKYSGLGSERRINNGTGREIEVECGMGSVEVNFQPQK